MLHTSNRTDWNREAWCSTLSHVCLANFLNLQPHKGSIIQGAKQKMILAFFTSQFIQQSKLKFSNWFKETTIFFYYYSHL